MLIVFFCDSGIARLTPGDAFIPTRSLALPSRPYGKRSSSRSQLVTPAWLQSPEHLRRPGDFRSYCHAPARLWPSEPSTDSLDLTHYRPAHGARLFQTGALSAHRCPVKPGIKGEAVTVGSRQTLHSSPWRSFRSRFSVCQPCRFNPSQPPKGGAITPGLRRRFESPPVPGSAS